MRIVPRSDFALGTFAFVAGEEAVVPVHLGKRLVRSGMAELAPEPAPPPPRPVRRTRRTRRAESATDTVVEPDAVE